MVLDEARQSSFWPALVVSTPLAPPMQQPALAGLLYTVQWFSGDIADVLASVMCPVAFPVYADLTDSLETSAAVTDLPELRKSTWAALRHQQAPEEDAKQRHLEPLSSKNLKTLEPRATSPRKPKALFDAKSVIRPSSAVRAADKDQMAETLAKERKQMTEIAVREQIMATAPRHREMRIARVSFFVFLFF